MGERIILVDTEDLAIGDALKMDVHHNGLLHRTFSIFIFDDGGRLLQQQRALGKYHSQGLWTNTCCGHPRHGETTVHAARRRLQEEMGIDCDDLIEVHSFIYREQVSNQLIEHEYDHVFVGLSYSDPVPNRDEALDWKWWPLAELACDINVAPDSYTVWFRKILHQEGVERIRAWNDLLRRHQ
ncbi:isopentenyl-diphosphate Delta-isomerase [Pseudomonas sp. p50]|uniref:isopentenyl-diphosphate Delta-isomerase n=1 Tax=Pseudomonas sp. p50(2008) TaxID=2816832 RepID=UPI00188AF83C|nr:isopentenyl-diphosphate Delta-isomerase [Pseudomonas sp. p50(2008)]MBF4557488.1 isopentenyl-diphosphate Delta-isomerase [Pseudomonas sp. p50(2008)]